MANEAVPGPWQVEHRAAAAPKWGVYALPRGRRQNVASFIPNEATAHLIAAAPSLLEATEAALAMVRQTTPDGALLARLEAAIAQARGANP